MRPISPAGSGSSFPHVSSPRAGAHRLQPKVNTGGGEAAGGADKTKLQGQLEQLAHKAGGAADPSKPAGAGAAAGPAKGSAAASPKSLAPTPSSTMDFAQQRAPGGAANGAAAGKAGAAGAAVASSTDPPVAPANTSAANGSAASADDAMFSKLDTNGDGAISKSEFDTAVASSGQGGHHGAHVHAGSMLSRPSAAASNDSSGATGSTGAATSTDPLDTNGDGVVSAEELAAGEVKDLVSSLSSVFGSGANSGAGGISPGEANAIRSQFDAAIAAMQSGGSSGSANTSSNASPNGGGSTASWNHRAGRDLSSLNDLVNKQYSQTAANYAQAPMVSVSA